MGVNYDIQTTNLLYIIERDFGVNDFYLKKSNVLDYVINSDNYPIIFSIILKNKNKDYKNEQHKKNFIISVLRTLKSK